MARKTECIAMLLAGGQGSRCGYDAGSVQEAAAGDLAIHCVYSLRFKNALI